MPKQKGYKTTLWHLALVVRGSQASDDLNDALQRLLARMEPMFVALVKTLHDPETKYSWTFEVEDDPDEKMTMTIDLVERPKRRLLIDIDGKYLIGPKGYVKPYDEEHPWIWSLLQGFIDAHPSLDGMWYRTLNDADKAIRNINELRRVMKKGTAGL